MGRFIEAIIVTLVVSLVVLWVLLKFGKSMLCM